MNCPVCHREIDYSLDDVVASRRTGRVREYHAACLPDAPDREPANVSQRMAAILDESVAAVTWPDLR